MTAVTVALGRSSAGRLRIARPTALAIGVLLLVGLVALAVLGPLVSGHDAQRIGTVPFEGPSTVHWLGTDNLGRDSFTRLSIALGYTIVISAVASLVAMVVGTVLGVLAGYLGGVLDLVTMRGVEVLMSVPAILMALVIGVIFGPGVVPLVVAMSIVSAPLFARVMRGPIMVLRERDFVTAATISGVSRTRIAAHHLLPNALTPMLVQLANTASLAVLLEASLSYLGQGVQPPEPSAGRMISEYQRFMQSEPQLVLVPAVAVTVLTFAWNLIADGLQGRLAGRTRQLQVPLRAGSAPLVRPLPATGTAPVRAGTGSAGTDSATGPVAAPAGAEQ